ncbi:hypothetical protein [Aquimarina mytili]|uniref:Uncharacterized protein n=1 Tax=Aquimarina mytili TaxID=874423 RepID=A0A936ZUH2_9FLAO|nr:hypothetical protein [Aquimarina mytili]MBL0684547.1 hypothetical protein [Aquimarina mytili]
MENNVSHTKLSDNEFITQFKNCTLNPSIFNHEAHLRLSWILINELGLDSAIKTIQLQLQNFVKSVGATDKYHATLTIAAMKTVHHFMQKSKTENFENFISENQRLKTNFKDLINNHYSIDIFTSEQAKVNFLEPDLLPFE